MSEPHGQSSLPEGETTAEQPPILQLVSIEVAELTLVETIEGANPADALALVQADRPQETAEIIQLFPDEIALFEDSKENRDEPVIQLLPENPTEEEILRLKVKMLEAKLARRSAQLDFAERIDVDHLEWRKQQNAIRHLQAGNVLLIILSIVLMISAGCLAVIR
jgi:hypothetical protein